MSAKLEWSLSPPVLFNNTIIPTSSQVQNLALLIDNTFSWGPQIEEVSYKVYTAVGSLQRLQNFTYIY